MIGMRSNIGAAIVCVAVGLSVGLAAPKEKPLVLGPEPTTLPVVATLDELKKVNETGAVDATVRLGIEAEKVPLGSGALIYCLWDGNGGPRGTNGVVEQQKNLGPCTVRIRRINEKGESENPRVMDVMYARAQAKFAGDSLFLAQFVPWKTGKYSVQVLSSDNDLLAQASMECTAAENHGWHTVRNAGDGFRPANLSIPKWDDAVFSVLPKILPTFLPKENESATTMAAEAADGGQITLTSKEAMRPTVQDVLLVRVFVNGEPMDERAKRIADETVKVPQRLVRERASQLLKFAVSMKPEDYIANAGDVVELQFAYSENGTQYAPREDEQVPMQDVRMIMRLGRGTPVRLSNKVRILGTPKGAASQPASQPGSRPAAPPVTGPAQP